MQTFYQIIKASLNRHLIFLSVNLHLEKHFRTATKNPLFSKQLIPNIYDLTHNNKIDTVLKQAKNVMVQFAFDRTHSTC